MAPWQKRLADLAHLLMQCHHNYMEPEQFRRSGNQFLQTSRTVTFIIQKNKDSIPDFNGWYARTVLDPWKNDKLMQWAKDARNTIEKEGDLDLYSSVSLRLFFGYREEADLSLQLEDSQVLHAGIKKLMRLAQKNLPSGVSRAAAIKVERRWVADTLPEFELINAICIIYRRVHDVCKSLAIHSHVEIDKMLPDPSEFDEMAQETRQIRYFKLSSTGSFSMSATRKTFKGDDIPPEFAADVARISGLLKEDRSIDGAHHWLSVMAEMTFSRDGYHTPMAFLYDSEWKPIDMISFQPDDTTDKYIIWRDLGERVRTKSAHGLSFVGEAWLRGVINLRDQPISSQPIIGEQLQVVSLDRRGNYRESHWEIKRESGIPSLCRTDKNKSLVTLGANFLAPVMSAFGLTEFIVE